MILMREFFFPQMKSAFRLFVSFLFNNHAQRILKSFKENIFSLSSSLFKSHATISSWPTTTQARKATTTNGNTPHHLIESD